MTKTLEIPWLSLVTAADADWSRHERLIQQDLRRRPTIDWRASHPYNFTIEAPSGYVFLADDDGAILRDDDGAFLIEAETP